MTEYKKLKMNYKEFGKIQINEQHLQISKKLMVCYLTVSPIMDKELKTQIISDDKQVLSSILRS